MTLGPTAIQRLLDNTTDGLFVMGLDGTIQSWNWGASQTTGHAESDVLGTSAYERLLPKDQAAEMAKAVHEAVATGSAVFEAEAVRSSGDRFQCMIILRTLEDTSGNPLIGVSLRDVSGEKRLEQQLFEQIWALTEAQGFLQGVLDSAHDYTIVATDTEGKIRAWSAGGLIHYGYTPREVVGRSVAEILFSVEEVKAGQVDRALETARDKPFEDEFRSVDKSGRRFPTRMSIGARRDRDGQFLGFVFIVKDVTDEKQAAEAIRRKTAFVTLMQNVAVAANEANTIEDAMQRALDEVCLATGWPVGHVYVRSGEWTSGLSPAKIWHLDDPDRFETFRRVTEATRVPPGVGLPGRVLATGTPHWIKDVLEDANFPRAKVAADIGVRAGFGFPVLVGKEIVAVLEFFSDHVTEPDEQVLEVMGHVGTQLGRVVERVRADEERRAGMERVLEVEQLKDVNKFKEQFIRTISHELNTPITPIKLQLHLLQRAELGSLTNRQRHAVDVVHRNVERLELLVQDMLDVSRIQSGKLKIAREPTKLSDLIREASDLFAESAKQSGVELAFANGNGVEVDVDPRRIVQVLVNLISNALKFTPPGGLVSLEVRQERNQVMVRVVDTGLGLTKEQIAELFKPFSQAHDPAQLGQRGTGLGLYICKNLIEQHGGKVGCESAGAGKGSTFWFTVPTREKIMKKTPDAPSLEQAPTSPGTR